MISPDTGGLESKIRARLQELSPNDRKIADFLLSQRREAVFGTAESIGRQVGVSKAAVVRFASRLGYEGFSELQQDLQRVLGARLDAPLPLLHPNGRASIDEKTAFLRRIREARHGLSEKQVLLADFILTNYDAVAFLNATQLAREVGISESTVTRFAMSLGYEGYPDFQRDIQKIIREAITGPERLHLAMAEAAQTNTLARTIQRAVQNLQRLSESPPLEDLDMAAAACVRARRVFAVGLRASTFLATFFAYQLGKIRPAVEAITFGGTIALERLATAGREDLLVSIAFPRYPRETVEILGFARRQECQTLAVTDTPLSPLAKRAALVLLVPTEVAWYVDSNCAPTVLLTALLADIARLDRERAEAHLKVFERFAELSNTFYRDV